MNPSPDWHPSRDELALALRSGSTEARFQHVHDHINTGCSVWLAPLLQELTAASEGMLAMVQVIGLQPELPDLADYVYLNDRVPLDRGHFGEVYLACPRTGGEPVAIKFLQVRRDLGKTERQYFFAEAVAALRLDHPAIVKGYDANAVGDRLYYVMEYVPGPDLRTFQADRPLGYRPGKVGWSREIAGWLRHLACGLAHAHSQFVIHRDLNPRNILVRVGEGGAIREMKICDFGLSEQLDVSGQANLSAPDLGVIPFVAPEQLGSASGEPTSVGPATDLYALGAVGYYLLTGQPPFPHGPWQELRPIIREHHPAPPSRTNPDVHPDLETILLKCLRKPPAHRYASADELIEDLDLFLAGKRPRASRWVRGDLARRWLRNNPGPVRVVASISFLLLVLFVALLWAWREKSRADTNGASAAAHALTAREELLQRLTESARADLKRGLLAQAEKQYDRAVEIAPAQRQRQLEVERCRTLFALGRWGRLQAELARLADCADLTPRHQAQVCLHQGDLLLWESRRQDQQRGRQLLEQALAIPDGLELADEAFARGVLIDGARQAIEAFEQALRHEPYHLRARSALLFELVLTGQFDRAQEQARFLAAVFPDEPVVPLARAIMAALREDQTAQRQHRDDLARLVDPKQMTRLDGALRSLELAVRLERALDGDSRDLLDLVRAALNGPFSLLLGDLGALFRPIPASGFQFEGIPTTVGIGLPLMQRPTRLLEDLGRAHWHLTWGNFDRAEAILDGAARNSPEAMVLYLRGLLHLMRGIRQLRRGDNDGVMRETQLAHRCWAEAADAPTIMPSTSYRRSAAWVCLTVEAAWERELQQNETRSACAALGVGHPLASLMTVARHESQTPVVLLRHKDRFLCRLAEPRTRPDPARACLLPVLVQLLAPDEGRYLLACWRRDEPENIVPYQLSAKLEMQQGAFARALELTGGGLRVRRTDAVLLRIQHESRQALDGKVLNP